MNEGTIIAYRCVSEHADVAEIIVRTENGKITTILCSSTSVRSALSSLFPGGCYLGEKIAYEIGKDGSLTKIGAV